MFRKGCGSDNICRSDLSLSCSSSGEVPFVIGSSDFVTLVLVVTNLVGRAGGGGGGDPAFKPQLRIPVPVGVGIRKTAKECQEVVRERNLVSYVCTGSQRCGGGKGLFAVGG